MKMCRNAKLAEQPTIKMQMLPCLDPDHCEYLVNDIPWLDPPHHAGCDCDICFEFYRSLK